MKSHSKNRKNSKNSKKEKKKKKRIFSNQTQCKPHLCQDLFACCFLQQLDKLRFLTFSKLQIKIQIQQEEERRDA